MKRALAWIALAVSAAVLLLASVAGAELRGVRNNNPGNIIAGDLSAWPGAVGVDDASYMVFVRPIDGVRAIVINLRGYHQRYGLRTVRGIIGRWTRKNDTPASRRAYVGFVAVRLGVRPDQRLDLWDARVLRSLTRAIILYENGQDPYPEKLYRRVFPSL